MDYTVRPLAYGTGGVVAALQAATDECADCVQLGRDARLLIWAPIWQCGGPLDAPEQLPTGRVLVNDARRFTELTAR